MDNQCIDIINKGNGIYDISFALREDGAEYELTFNKNEDEDLIVAIRDAFFMQMPDYLGNMNIQQLKEEVDELYDILKELYLENEQVL